MPTYDYHCDTCGENFEMFQSFSEAPLTRCPGKSKKASPEGCTAPGKGKVEKLLSTPAIIFKGKGFYKTDSKAANSSNGSDTSSQPSPKEASPKTSPKETSPKEAGTPSSSDSNSSSAAAENKAK